MTTITLPRATVEQALEALEQSATTVPYEGFGMVHREAERKHQAAITALRAALAQQAERFCDTHCTWADHATGCVRAEPAQEPVAIVGTQEDTWKGYGNQWAPPGPPIKTVHMLRDLPHGTPLYTTPPLRAALAQQAEPAKTFLITGNEFCGAPPAPYATWGDALAGMLDAGKIEGLRISAHEIKE